VGEPDPKAQRGQRFLDAVERLGNRLPDPALLFVVALFVAWIASAAFAGYGFELPTKAGPEVRHVDNQLTARALVTFLTDMVKTFAGFPPFGLVLVALLGVGVAEQSGMIHAGLKRLLAITPRALLTPMVLVVSILSHSAADAGIVIVLPLGGLLFYAAGRHPLAGIACAFAGVSGGFSANPLPSGLDPLLQGLTQEAVRLIDPDRLVNPLCNWAFMGSSSLLIVLVGWYVTDRIVEPRLAKVTVAIDPNEPIPTAELTKRELRALRTSLATALVLIGLLILAVYPKTSPFRAPNGDLTAFGAPLMQAIIPLVFLLFLVPGLVHGFVSGTFRSSRDVMNGMSRTMSAMGSYIVLAFFASLFIYVFNKSQLGALLAVKGALFLKFLGLPGGVTIILFILLTSFSDLLIGSASAKWALLAPVFVPMLMQLHFSPELVQAAYRIGDSCSNVITPLNAYFPLILAFCHRYVKGVKVGTLLSMMAPYAGAFLVTWVLFLLAFWGLGLPLGIHGVYHYP
jgi:aminobenzoyl-glutamate transport protein